jgi:hypothetical protein
VQNPSTVVPFRTGREAPKAERSAMETRIFSSAEIGNWRVPPFQRPVRINAKVAALSEEIAHDGGVIPGVITLGKLKGDTAVYVVDGQHRIESFRITALPECIGDFRLCEFDSMAEMAEEFVRLNSALVRMRPDDVLRGLEASVKALRKIRSECRFVGYDQIRRGTTSPILGMSLTLRAWNGSIAETPNTTYNNLSATQIAETLTDDATEDLIQFLTVAHAAWGRDNEYARLWGSLNMGLCMWLWRRLVKDTDRSGSRRFVRLTVKQFGSCLMALSADGHYLEWLQGRQLNDRDRAPAYNRIKKIWAARLKDDLREKISFPQPGWSTK